MSVAFADFIDLADVRLGSAVVAANDEFFAEKDRLIDPKPPVWIDDRYTDRGKWMDGWETRRRREPGHDWCVIRLGASGVLRGVDVETTYFKGNYPEHCAIDVCHDPDRNGDWDHAAWREVLPKQPLAGHSHNLFEIAGATAATHLRLRIFPDGGVARLRAYGEVAPDWARLGERGEVDLAAVQNGGYVVVCSDMFFGHRQHLIMPGEAQTMGEGWETKRRRDGGNDWTIVRLGHAGRITRAEIDTRHFKGNAPGACSLEALTVAVPDPLDPHLEWQSLLERTPLQPDRVHIVDRALASIAGVTHVRFNIFPDGGVARLRLFGQLT